MVPGGKVEIGTKFFINGDLECKPLPSPQPMVVIAPATYEEYQSY